MSRQLFLPYLETPRLRLRRHDPARADAMFAAIDADRARLERLQAWAAWTKSPADEDAYVRHVLAQWDRGEFFDYAMFDRGDAYLGNIGVHTFNWTTGVAEIGYWIVGEHEGRGLVTEACRALIEQCFEREDLHRIEIRCDPANARSAAIPRRLGFTLEARLRQNGRDRFGQPHDTLVFARLKSDGPLSVDPDAAGRAARPACVRTREELDEGPQSFYPNSLELFGSSAGLSRGLRLDGLDVEHRTLRPGERSAKPGSSATRDELVFVLSGTPTLILNGRPHRLVPDDVVGLRRGEHGAYVFINETTLDVRFVIARGTAAEGAPEPGPRAAVPAARP